MVEDAGPLGGDDVIVVEDAGPLGGDDVIVVEDTLAAVEDNDYDSGIQDYPTGALDMNYDNIDVIID